jgi:hypothetical protein
MACQKCEGENFSGICIHCGRFVEDKSIYSARRSESEAAYLLEHFVEGTVWVIHEFGETKGVFTVGKRFEKNGKIRNHVTSSTGWQGEVFLDILQAKPYVH